MKKTLQQIAARLSSASPLAAEVDRRMGVPSGAPSVSRDRVGRLTISSLQPVRFAQADDAPTSVTVPPWLALFAVGLPPEAQRRLVELARASDPFFADALDSLLRGAAESDGTPRVPDASPPSATMPRGTQADVRCVERPPARRRCRRGSSRSRKVLDDAALATLLEDSSPQSPPRSKSSSLARAVRCAPATPRACRAPRPARSTSPRPRHRSPEHRERDTMNSTPPPLDPASSKHEIATPPDRSPGTPSSSPEREDAAAARAAAERETRQQARARGR